MIYLHAICQQQTRLNFGRELIFLAQKMLRYIEKYTECDICEEFSQYKQQGKIQSMKFQAKIKSISQYSIKGNRLLPAQIVTNDSNKNINVQDHLSNSSFTKNSRSFAQDSLPEVSRFSNRHTTDINAQRQANLRLSLDQINKNRSLDAQESSQDNLSDRKSIQEGQSQHKGLNSEKDPNMLRRLIMGDNNIDIFKDLRIQKITSNQTKLDQDMFEKLQKTSQQLHNSQALLKQKKNEGSISPSDSIWQKLYMDYKTKCSSLQRDNQEMAIKMRDADEIIEKLQRQKEIVSVNLNKSRQIIDQQAKRLLKLEQSIKINRSINDQLMKKQRENERRLKIIQQNQELSYKRRLDQTRAQITQQVNAKYDDMLRNHEREVFELKLRLIDQANQFEQAHKAKESVIAQLQSHAGRLLDNINHIHREKQHTSAQLQFIKQQFQCRAADLNQIIQQRNELFNANHQANEEVAKLTSQIIRIDQQNVRLDQQNSRISHEYSNDIGTAKEQIHLLTDRCLALQRQKDELIESIQTKDTQLAQLNIAKNNALLQVLSLKNELKKKKTQSDEKELKTRDEEIKSLKEQLLLKTAQSEQAVNEVIALNQELKGLLANAKLQFERQYNQKWKQNEQLMNESIMFKLQILQQLKNSSQEGKLLKAQLEELENQNEQLKNRNTKIEEERDILEQLIKSKVQTILKLNEEINQFQKRQIEKSENLKEKQSSIQNRQNELKEVQQQYLELIEGQLKKIHNMSDSQWDIGQIQYTDRFPITPTKSKSSYEQLQEGLSPQNSPFKNQYHVIDSPKESKVSELVMKIQYLTFINEALQQKVASLTELQENSNGMIMQKIRSFEQNLEKTLHQKHEIEYQNIELMRRLAQLTQKSISYETKIEWLEGIYRNLQENLLLTQQELLKCHFKYVNLKLQSRVQQASEDELTCQETNQDNIRSNQSKSPQEMLSNEKPIQEYKQNLNHPQEFCVQIQEKSIQDEKEAKQIALWQLLPGLPEIIINILAIQSEDDEPEEDEHPIINYILVSSEDQDEKQEQIVEKKQSSDQQDQKEGYKIEQPIGQELECPLHFLVQILPETPKEQSPQSILQDLIKIAIDSIQDKQVFYQNDAYNEPQPQTQKYSDKQTQELQNKLDMVE